MIVKNKLSKYKCVLLILFISFSCNSIHAQDCVYKMKFKYRCNSNNFDKILEYAFVYNNSNLITILFFDIKSRKLNRMITYQYVNNIVVGEINTNSFGEIIDFKKPVFDSSKNAYVQIPIYDMDRSPCTSMPNGRRATLKCIKNDCGNVVEEIEYSSISKKRVLSRYIYEYVY